MYCEQCGVELKPETRFCGMCGAQVGRNEDQLPRQATSRRVQTRYSRTVQPRLLMAISGVVVAVLLGTYIGIKVYAKSEAQKQLDSTIAEYSSFVDVSYDDVNVSIPFINTIVSNVVLKPVGGKERIIIDEVELSRSMEPIQYPNTCTSASMGFTFPPIRPLALTHSTFRVSRTT